MELPKLETFNKKLQRSWEIAKLSIDKSKKAIKKQFDKKKTKLSEIKARTQYVAEIFSQNNPQRSWAKNAMNSLRLQKKLDKEHSNQNYQKKGNTQHV